MLPSAADLLLATPLLLAPVILGFALLLGAKLAEALRASITIAVAMLGLNLIVWLMWSNLSEAAGAIAARTGFTRDVMDLGWPTAAAMAFGSTMGLAVIPAAIGINLLLLRLRLTRTLNIDIWNFWHFAFVGALLTAATGSFAMGLAGMALAIMLCLLMADWTARRMQSFYGVDGVSVPHLASVQIYPIAVGVNWLLDRIPGVNSINIQSDALSQRLGLLADPIALGFGIGITLAAFAYLDPTNLIDSLHMIALTGVIFAAAMLILPKMAQLLMEGLAPISEAARGFAGKWSENREINVGLDSAILIGHPSIMMASALLVPISIVLSLILPGNRVVLFADLTVIPFVIAMAAPVVQGNVFRLVVIGVVMMVPGFYIAGHLAEAFTAMAFDAGFTKPTDATQITSIVDGFIWPSFALTEIATRFGWSGLGIVFIALGGGLFWSRQRHGLKD
ncbi:MAG: PTS sugar transporter subunit IIC [Aestuariivirgaceae bacterium]|nr:PTS sugar transporter subunit IIC [Aestuariivirgaceae bacterium]